MNKLILRILLIFLVLSNNLNGQQVKSTIHSTLAGVLLDERTNQPIPGASVLIKGTTHGVVTDVDGNFYFQTGQKFPFTLVISSVGYQKREFIAEGTPVKIYLKELTEELNEIVVTSRRRKEAAQDVPIPITAIGGQRWQKPVHLM